MELSKIFVAWGEIFVGNTIYYIHVSGIHKTTRLNGKLRFFSPCSVPITWVPLYSPVHHHHHTNSLSRRAIRLMGIKVGIMICTVRSPSLPTQTSSSLTQWFQMLTFLAPPPPPPPSSSLLLLLWPHSLSQIHTSKKILDRKRHFCWQVGTHGSIHTPLPPLPR